MSLMPRRPRFGSIYRRRKRHPDGTMQTLSNWWIKYSRDGQIFRESSESDNYDEAERLLKRRLGEIVTGKFAGLTPERVRAADKEATSPRVRQSPGR
jgi:transposase-like protein